MYTVIELQNGVVGGNKWEFHDKDKTDRENSEDALSKYFSILSVAAKSNVSVHSVVLLDKFGISLERACIKHGEDDE